MNCPQCGTDNPDGFRFCGHCGCQLTDQTEAPPKTLYFGSMQIPNRAKMVLIKGEGSDGVSYQLNGTEHVLGRTESAAIPFPDDPFLSPRHACFYYENDKLFVRDENSINGVFVRITSPIILSSGSQFLSGEQLFQFDLCAPDSGELKPDKEGTFFYSSPQRPSRFKLIQVLRGNETGMIFRAPSDKVTIGREGNDINFPDDPYISGHHTMIVAHGNGFTLEDMNSRNGTFVKLEEPFELKHGDFVFVGRQLMRVEFS